MSLCDSQTKNQIKNMTKYPNVEAELASMKWLGVIKKLVYTCGRQDLNKVTTDQWHIWI